MISDPAARPPLDAERLAAADPDLLTGLTVEVVEEAASTNALVIERARSGAAEGLVVAAEHQNAGRGRLDRTWETPPRSGLTFSVLLRPTAPTASWPWLPLLAGYAVDKALKAAGYEASVKWPNDVLLDGRKVAGILVERVETDAGPAAVVGIGLNVGMTAEELPVPEATSLAVAAAGDRPRPDGVAVSLLASLWESYIGVAGGRGPGRDAAGGVVRRGVHHDRPAGPGRPPVGRGAHRHRDRHRSERATAGGRHRGERGGCRPRPARSVT